MIFKILYKYFPKSYAKVLFLSQKKPQSFEKLSLCFTDSNGVKYYKYNDDLEMPLIRKGHFQKCFAELDYGLRAQELERIVSAMKLALNAKDKKGFMSPDLAKIGYLLEEIQDRQDNLIHPDILMDMVGCTYIREDENPAEFDQEIHTQKVEQFNKDHKTGLYDFFLTAGLKECAPYLEQSGIDWETNFMIQRARTEALGQLLDRYFLEKQ